MALVQKSRRSTGSSTSSRDVSVTVKVKKIPSADTSSTNATSDSKRNKALTGSKLDGSKNYTSLAETPLRLNNTTVIDDEPAPFTNPKLYSVHKHSCKNTTGSENGPCRVKGVSAQVLFDHTIAVLWIFGSKTLDDSMNELGVTHLSWALHYLYTLKNYKGEYTIDVLNLIAAFEDMVIVKTAAMAPMVDKDDDNTRYAAPHSPAQGSIEGSARSPTQSHSESKGSKESAGGSKEPGGSKESARGSHSVTFEADREKKRQRRKQMCSFYYLQKQLIAEDSNVFKSVLEDRSNVTDGRMDKTEQATTVDSKYLWIPKFSTPKSLNYSGLMNRYGNSLESRSIKLTANDSTMPSGIPWEKMISGTGSNQSNSQDKSKKMECDQCLECPPICEFSRNALNKFLGSWRQEQMGKIEAELARLKTIEKYMKAMDDNYANKPDSTQGQTQLNKSSAEGPQASSSANVETSK